MSALDILGARLAALNVGGEDDVEALLGAYDVVGATALRPGFPAARYGTPAGFHPGLTHPAAQQFNPRMAALAARSTYLRNRQPNRSNRIILPMTSSGNIVTSSSVTARPQSQAYRPEKVIVGGTPSNWLIDDIKVGNRSQFSQSGSIPAESFASNALGNEVTFETVQTAMDFVMAVTYVGTNSAGEQFRCTVFGTAVDY